MANSSTTSSTTTATTVNVATTASTTATTATAPTTSTTSTATTPTPATTATTATTATSTAPREDIIVSAFFARDEHVALVDRTIPYTVATSSAALTELLAGPNAAEQELGMATAIPEGTTLRGVTISPAGTATVDLSSEFESGGGSLSMMMRLAQVVYTLTQFPTVSDVNLSIEGVPSTVFGSEGLVLDHPMTRADFEDLTPAILVEGPAPFEAVEPQMRVHGTSNVFEATFMVRLSDSTGRVLYEYFQMATSGTGTRGTFDFVIDVVGATPGAGTLRLWEPSAMDGSDTNVVEIPVQLP